MQILLRLYDTRKNAFLAWGLLLGSVLLVSCGSTQRVGDSRLDEPTGKASYYAWKFQGRPTANGEIFNQKALTAAHRTLPFGTRVRVTRTDSPDELSVVVRINDRGPFKRGRIIDLTRAAARRLEMIEDGLATVRLEIVSYPEGAETASDSAKHHSW